MGHTPYGYIIQNGKAIIDEMKAVQVRDLYQAYLSGLSLRDAAKKAGINCYHATIAKMLTNKKYLGDEYYPPLIDEHIFEQAQAERLRRAQMLGRIREPKMKEDVSQSLNFTVPTPKQLYDDPFKQAEYVYSLIESEVTIDGDK
ncbi:MAG: recombinase family protein [Thermodesulforhabdaceae bacterium]